MATTMRLAINQLINDGRGLWFDHGDNLVNILPPNVYPKSIENVERYEDYLRGKTVLAVKFANGHVATLKICLDGRNGVDPDALKEFQARCIMIHDI